MTRSANPPELIKAGMAEIKALAQAPACIDKLPSSPSLASDDQDSDDDDDYKPPSASPQGHSRRPIYYKPHEGKPKASATTELEASEASPATLRSPTSSDPASKASP